MLFAVQIDNRTPFDAATHVQFDADGQEVLVAMFAASFQFSEESGAFEPAAKPLAVSLGDAVRGVPGLSSTSYDSDTFPSKPGVDVIVNGTAYAPNSKPVREMQVGLQFGGIRKVLHVTGDRLYDMGSYSAPHPFMTMPVVYERAYGGTTQDGRMDPRNPVGVGHHHAVSADPAVKTHAPNITYPDEVFRSPSDKPRPAGLGVVARNWQPRLKFAGTYDQAWQDNQWPLPPKDLDPRHHHSAPEDQQLPRLGGGETATVIGMTPSGRWDFKLPTVTAPIRLVYEDRVEDHPFRTDLVVIEPDLLRVTLKARLAVTPRRNAPALQSILFGHVTPALIMAHRKRKAYFATEGHDGSLRGVSAWRA